MKKFAVSIFILFFCLGLAHAADPFILKDVEVEHEDFMEISMVQGDITNNSGKSYEGALFKLSFYDKNDKLLGAVDVAVENFENGETATFEGVSQKDLSEWETYRIRLEMSY
jgi:hypothetical protein